MMGYVGEILKVQRQRHVQRQDEPAVSVLREGSQTPADQILELKHELQPWAQLAVSTGGAGRSGSWGRPLAKG